VRCDERCDGRGRLEYIFDRHGMRDVDREAQPSERFDGFELTTFEGKRLQIRNGVVATKPGAGVSKGS